MRTVLITAALLGAALAAGAPRPIVTEPADERVLGKEDAASFARALHLLIEQVTRSFVKPLASEDVHVAALTGLNHAARKSPPRDLRSQARQAVNLATAIREGSSPDLIVPPGDDPREQLLLRVRKSVGGTLSNEAALRAAARGILTILDDHSGLVTVEDQRLDRGRHRRRGH